jgi:hypothetical protein
MDDQLQKRFNEVLEYLGIFEGGLTRLSRDPNNTELLGEIGELWVRTKTICDAIGRPNLADCSDGIQAVLDEIRESSAATEQTIAQLLAKVAGMYGWGGGRLYCIENPGSGRCHFSESGWCNNGRGEQFFAGVGARTSFTRSHGRRPGADVERS